MSGQTMMCTCLYPAPVTLACCGGTVCLNCSGIEEGGEFTYYPCAFDECNHACEQKIRAHLAAAVPDTGAVLTTEHIDMLISRPVGEHVFYSTGDERHYNPNLTSALIMSIFENMYSDMPMWCDDTNCFHDLDMSISCGDLDLFIQVSIDSGVLFNVVLRQPDGSDLFVVPSDQELSVLHCIGTGDDTRDVTHTITDQLPHDTVVAVLMRTFVGMLFWGTVDVDYNRDHDTNENPYIRVTLQSDPPPLWVKYTEHIRGVVETFLSNQPM